MIFFINIIQYLKFLLLCEYIEEKGKYYLFYDEICNIISILIYVSLWMCLLISTII